MPENADVIDRIMLLAPTFKPAECLEGVEREMGVSYSAAFREDLENASRVPFAPCPSYVVHGYDDEASAAGKLADVGQGRVRESAGGERGGGRGGRAATAAGGWRNGTRDRERPPADQVATDGLLQAPVRAPGGAGVRSEEARERRERKTDRERRKREKRRARRVWTCETRVSNVYPLQHPPSLLS